jgi:energy-converting hydrogenase Eha subunit C
MSQLNKDSIGCRKLETAVENNWSESICTMLASSLAGLIWFQFGATTTFLITAIATIIIVLYISTIPKPETVRTEANL